MTRFAKAFPGFKRFRVGAIATLLVLPGPLLMADDTAFTPFYGYRFGGSFNNERNDESADLREAPNFGGIFSFRGQDKRVYELLYSQQSTEIEDGLDQPDSVKIRMHYVHIGGLVELEGNGYTPFVSGGLGLTLMRPDEPGWRDETQFSLSLGGGVIVPLSEHIGLRFEFRGYGTLVNSSGHLFCDNDQCRMTVEGDLLSQFETNIGIRVGF